MPFRRTNCRCLARSPTSLCVRTAFWDKQLIESTSCNQLRPGHPYRTTLHLCLHRSSRYQWGRRPGGACAGQSWVYLTLACTRRHCGGHPTDGDCNRSDKAAMGDAMSLGKGLSSSQDVVTRPPRILFLGGDAVSLCALEAIVKRLQRIVHQNVRASSLLSMPAIRDLDRNRPLQGVGEHITVICPALPLHSSLDAIVRRHSRSYPVARFCVEHGIPVIPVDHPKSMSKSVLLQEMLQLTDRTVGRSTDSGTCVPPFRAAPFGTWRSLDVSLRDFDVAVVVSFRYFLPKRLLRLLPRTVNMHPSLLPKYRGASPIFSTLIRGETVGGASIIQMTADQTMMDSGNILWRSEIPISKDTDIRQYFPMVTRLGAAGLCNILFGEPSDTPSLSNDVTMSEVARPDEYVHPPSANLLTPAITSLKSTHSNGDAFTALSHNLPSARDTTQVPAHIDPERSLSDSVHSSYCDWPKTFDLRWNTAAVQQYEAYAHYSLDPYHAPLLPRDAAVLRFSRQSSLEVFGVWRAFVGGLYFQPSVNAILDKSRTPVRNQLLLRAVRRLEREKRRASTSAANLVPGCVPVQGDQKGKGCSAQGAPSGMLPSPRDEDLVRRAENSLRLCCTFTDALHPDLLPKAVCDELKELERTGRTTYLPPPCSSDLHFGKAEAAAMQVPPTCFPSLINRMNDADAPDSSIVTTEGIAFHGAVVTSRQCVEARDVPQPHQHPALSPSERCEFLESDAWIPPGTAYFPQADESTGLIKSKTGWFCWREAQLQDGSKPQPVQLLRKGLAMKCGVLYNGVFTEYARDG